METEGVPRGRVIFSHGHESGPRGSKILALSEVAEGLGWAAEAIDYRDLRDDPAGRRDRLVARIGELDGPVVLAGSSMGGWVAMAAAEQRAVAGLWLMAPALFLEDRIEGGVVPATYRPRADRVMLVHGWGDDIIPWRNSLRFAWRSGATVHFLQAGHRLESAIPDLRSLFGNFLRRCTG